MINDKDVAILFRYVNKTYRLFKNEKARFLSFFSSRVRHEDKKAVDNVSFVIKKGESVALFGRNGAGKSTILKMIAGVAYPTSGIIRVNGRVSALLELSAGFDQEMTGRENIFFRGEVLGVDRKELRKLESRIIDFAELGDYIDQPVRTYSSGMKARLGFSINVNIQPDIVIVDEALSVGDASFRRKCQKKIQEILENGTTFLLVTHSAAEAKRFCRRGLVIRDGRLVCDADIATAARLYNEYLQLENGLKQPRAIR